MKAADLSTFERIGQKQEFQKRAEGELSKVLTKEDAPLCMRCAARIVAAPVAFGAHLPLAEALMRAKLMRTTAWATMRVRRRLVFNDAATYNIADGTGGMNGSVVLSKEEFNRPENKGFGDLELRLEKAKQAIDEVNAKLKSQPVSWADLLVLAAKVTTQAEWKDIKIRRAARPEGGEQIVRAFGTQWDVQLGRMDSAESVPGRALAPGASAQEMKAFMIKLGAKPGAGGFLSAKPPFWERPAFTIYPATQDDSLVCVRHRPVLCSLRLAPDQQFPQHMSAPRGTAVRAALAGRVLIAGSACRRMSRSSLRRTRRLRVSRRRTMRTANPSRAPTTRLTSSTTSPSWHRSVPTLTVTRTYMGSQLTGFSDGGLRESVQRDWFGLDHHISWPRSLCWWCTS
jgi:Peroxidase